MYEIENELLKEFGTKADFLMKSSAEYDIQNRL